MVNAESMPIVFIHLFSKYNYVIICGVRLPIDKVDRIAAVGLTSDNMSA
jgi:hypothetical protein